MFQIQISEPGKEMLAVAYWKVCGIVAGTKFTWESRSKSWRAGPEDLANFERTTL